MNNTSLFLGLFIAVGFVTINNTLPIIASPYIVGDLGGSNDIAFYAITFYSLGNVLGVPLGRGCIGRIRPCRFFLISLILFALLSWAAALAPTYPLFLCVRLLQGINAGTIFPIVSTLFFSLAPEDKKIAISSILVTIFTVLPALGAAWGGWISYDYKWRRLFYINVPLLMLLAVFLWNKLRRNPISFPSSPFDLIGYCAYCLTFLSFSLVITLGQQLDWFRCSLITGLTVLGVFSLGFFILWELQHPFPILDLRMLKKFTFSFALLSLGLLFSAYFGMVILLADWLNLWVSYTPNWIALTVGTMAIAGLIPTFLLAKGYHLIDCRIPLVISIALLSISCFYTSFFNIEINFGRIAFSRVLAGFGLAFFLAPIFRLCFHSFTADKALSVVSFFQLVRMLSSGLGAAIYITLWQRRQIFFHERLGEDLTVFSPITQDYYVHAEEIQIEGLQASAELNHLLDRQSIALALDDCFYFIGFLLIALLAMTLATWVCKCRGFIPEAEKNI